MAKMDPLDGAALFRLYDTYGFPVELSTEEAFKQGLICQPIGASNLMPP